MVGKTNRRWIIVDVSCLSYRALYSTGGLTSGPESTGTLYGFLAEVERLRQRFQSNLFAFCFDAKTKSKRREIYPQYKANRIATTDPIQAEARASMHRQVDLLRSEVLRDLGYKNLFYEDGYEADDSIASCVDQIPTHDAEVIIVSADSDLYQLLGGKVVQYNPCSKNVERQVYTEGELAKDYWGIRPNQWARVKAISGCEIDNVEGVEGVREKTASKYIMNKLNGPKREAIHKFIRSETYPLNLRLCTLPFEGTLWTAPTYERPERKDWNEVCRRLGFPSLADRERPERKGIERRQSC